MTPAFNLTPNNRPALFDKILRLDPTRQWRVIIEERKSKRSLEQNSRLWKLYTLLGQHIGESPDHIHELMGWKFLRELKTINGEQVEVIKSTTKLTTKEMAEYQNAIEDWAAMNTGFLMDEGA